MNLILNFSFKLVLVLVLVFGIHLFILHSLNQPLFNNLITASYIVNAMMAIIIYGSLVLLRKKYLDVLGFIFMAGSFLKFGVYFIFFYPEFRADGEIIRLEATSFLIPYLACLVIETFYLVKLLNNKV
jgi:hypothetical protein